ncbi:MAG: hypothetical protein JXR83_03965 [Deltaproteobacteria bacterium]|nr:hypothetical protein [Deltaproteobacteria bacterium]
MSQRSLLIACLIGVANGGCDCLGSDSILEASSADRGVDAGQSDRSPADRAGEDRAGADRAAVDGAATDRALADGGASDRTGRDVDAGSGSDGAATDRSAADGGSQDAAPPVGLAPWVVFSRADTTTSMSDNLLLNPAFEELQSASVFTGWRVYNAGYQVGSGEGRSGNAAKLVRLVGDTAQYGVYQSVTLNQTAAKPIYLAAWSRSDGVTGEPDSAYGLYVDISYTTISEDPVNGCDPAVEDHCSLWGQVPDPPFDVGSHGWQLRDAFAIPQYPIKSLSAYLLLRGDHSGTVWFDDVVIKQVLADVVAFDGEIVATLPPAGTYRGGSPLAVDSAGGIGLSLWEQGGALASIDVAGSDRLAGALDYASGFFLRDQETATWIAPGGSVLAVTSTLVHSAHLASENLDFEAQYQALADRIRIRAQLSALDTRERAITLYFALPLAGTGWSWSADTRGSVPFRGAIELQRSAPTWLGEIGATGATSAFPFATLFDASAGIAIGYPLDQLRIARLVANPLTRQLYIAFDLGLSPSTARFPSQAWAEIVLYRTAPGDPRWGFRSALQGYYERFPDHFARRIAPEKEGIWVAFADLSQMQHGPGESLADFYIGFHEGSAYDADFDAANNVDAYRYIIEPASTWLRITDGGVDPFDPGQVQAYLEGLFASGTASERRLAEKTLSSAVHDVNGDLVYRPYSAGPPWCAGPCALFYLDADPDVAVSPYTVNQASYHWNATALQSYQTHPGLAGEYIDSFVMWAMLPNFRAEHWAASDIPLSFTHEQPRRVALPVVFSTIEFARWLRPQLPAGKHLIANAMLIGAPWGAELFDFMGQEIDWVEDVGGYYAIVPESDAMLGYRRAMSGPRPYGFLMNTDFNNMSSALSERYMRICLFYGIYPSFFSSNASEDNYFENPALYDRDRPLFKRYIPIIRAINSGGYRPLTAAVSSADQVLVERFGDWPGNLYFTLRNLDSAPQAIALTLDRGALGLSSSATVISLVQGAPDAALGAGQATLTVTVPGSDVEALRLAP